MSFKAYIGGLDITTQLDAAREHIGYCPQFDALLENLTAKEHLFLYAAIKGIPYNMVNILILILSFLKFSNFKEKRFS